METYQQKNREQSYKTRHLAAIELCLAKLRKMSCTICYAFYLSLICRNGPCNVTCLLIVMPRYLYMVSLSRLVRPVTMETRCFQKKLEFQRHPLKDLCTARYEHKPWTKKTNFQKLRKKSFLGRSWAKIGLRKLSQMLFRSDEIPSPRQTSIDKTNDSAMKSERGALVRGSDPPSGQCVHKTTGDRWRAPPARRQIQTHLGAAV